LTGWKCFWLLAGEVRPESGKIAKKIAIEHIARRSQGAEPLDQMPEEHVSWLKKKLPASTTETVGAKFQDSIFSFLFKIGKSFWSAMVTLHINNLLSPFLSVQATWVCNSSESLKG